MTDFRETKIRILSEEHSRAFQEAVIAAGGGWNCGERVVRNLRKGFLFVSEDLRLSYCDPLDFFESQGYREIQFPLPSKGHPHAELMVQYAEDAKSHAEPWELWQTKGDSHIWWDCRTHPLWGTDTEYRRKPMTHIIHGVEIPDLRVAPEFGDYYYLADPLSRTLFSARQNYKKLAVKEWVKRGLVYQHSEEGKQAAILHSKAMLDIK